MAYPPKPAKPRAPHSFFGALPPRPLFTQRKPPVVVVVKCPPGQRKKPKAGPAP